MKLIKKLLPITTLLTTTSIVVPITSCSSKPVFSTDKLNFEPSTKHADSYYQLTPQEVANDYFSDPLHFIQDIVYARLESINKEYIEKTKDSHMSDINYYVKTDINNISLKEVIQKKISDDSGWEYDAWGSYVSFDLTFILNRTYTKTFSEEELEKGISSEVYKTIDKETYKVEFKDFFAYLYYEEVSQTWAVGLYANKDSNWYRHWQEDLDHTTIDTVCRNNKYYSYTDTTKGSQTVTNARQLENDDFREILDDIGANESYYLKNVIPKIINK